MIEYYMMIVDSLNPANQLVHAGVKGMKWKNHVYKTYKAGKASVKKLMKKLRRKLRNFADNWTTGAKSIEKGVKKGAKNAADSWVTGAKDIASGAKKWYDKKQRNYKKKIAYPAANKAGLKHIKKETKRIVKEHPDPGIAGRALMATQAGARHASGMTEVAKTKLFPDAPILPMTVASGLINRNRIGNAFDKGFNRGLKPKKKRSK